MLEKASWWKQVLVMASCAFALLMTGLPSRAVTFAVTGSEITKDGVPFLIKGVNVNGPNWVWGRGTEQDVGLIVDTWKFNTVRVNCRIIASPTENDNLAALVTAFTSRGVVVQLAVHDMTGGYFTDPASFYPGTTTSGPSLTQLRDWWVARANEYKGNPYVWFNIANEPGAIGPVPQKWLTMHEVPIAAIRAAGANNIIVCDENDYATASSSGRTSVETAGSAVLTYGPTLRGYGNIAYAIHVYNQWNAGGTAVFDDYITRVQNAGYAIHVGEWGQSPYNYVESVTATTNMFKVIRPKNIGRIAWHWYGGDNNRLTTETNSYTPGGGFLIDKTDGTRPTNLTWMGELAWDDNRGLPLIIDNVPTPLATTGWTATAFSQDPNSPVSSVLDGSYDTRYLSAAAVADGQWLQIDMQSARTVDRVDVQGQWGVGAVNGINVYVSNSAAPSSSDLVATVLNKQTEKRITFPARSGRYIRIETTGGLSSTAWWEIFEVKVYNSGSSTPAPGTGTGLKGEYFNDSASSVYPLASPFTGTPVLTRTDPTIDFSWSGSPATGVTADNFSVRWTGQVQAPVTGSYTFTITGDDGIRLSLNGAVVISGGWRDQAPTAYTYTTTLTAGQKYDIKLEFYERGGGAAARLQWTYPGQAIQVIPASRLYPATGSTAAPTPTPTPASGVNLINNPGFEAEQFNTQTPSGWSENEYDGIWNLVTPPDASYSSSGGANTGTYKGTHWRPWGYRVYTFQTKTGLANGLYTARCRGRSSGGQITCQLEAANYGSATRSVALPVSGSYGLVEIKDINVTNGQCTVGIWSDANTNNWAYFDDFEFFKQ